MIELLLLSKTFRFYILVIFLSDFLILLAAPWRSLSDFLILLTINTCDGPLIILLKVHF